MRLRKFMKFFNAIAIIYLQNYLNWFLVLKKERIKPIKWQHLLVLHSLLVKSRYNSKE